MNYHNPKHRTVFKAEREKFTGGCCEICGVQVAKLVIDHDHATNRIRGLLCPNHNSGLGFFNDDPALLHRAAIYIQNFRERYRDAWPVTGFERTAARPGTSRSDCERIMRTLLADSTFESDRARARELSKLTGSLYTTAQTRLTRFKQRESGG